MENASKALIMAGSILISIILIGLLVYGYRQLSDLEQTRTDSEDNEKLAEYMREFEQYNRTLYGSELLSLANLQEDYNESRDVEEGYDAVTIKVEIKEQIPRAGSYFRVDKRDLGDIKADKDNIEREINDVGKVEYNGKTVKYYYSKSYREIALAFGLTVTSSTLTSDIPDMLEVDIRTKDLYADIQEYERLTSIYNEFRTGKQFECEAEYYEQNGRIKEMTFTEI